MKLLSRVWQVTTNTFFKFNYIHWESEINSSSIVYWIWRQALQVWCWEAIHSITSELTLKNDHDFRRFFDGLIREQQQFELHSLRYRKPVKSCEYRSDIRTGFCCSKIRAFWDAVALRDRSYWHHSRASFNCRREI